MENDVLFEVVKMLNDSSIRIDDQNKRLYKIIIIGTISICATVIIILINIRMPI